MPAGDLQADGMPSMNPQGTDTAGKPSQLKIIVWLQ
jgi:hypothetical protein